MGVQKLKTAMITGISGQDGYYLTELLLEKDYVVHRKLMDSSKINKMGRQSRISLEKGSEKVYQDYLLRHHSGRKVA